MGWRPPWQLGVPLAAVSARTSGLAVRAAAGSWTVIYGNANGISIKDDLWERGIDGILGTRGITDGFGFLDNSVMD